MTKFYTIVFLIFLVIATFTTSCTEYVNDGVPSYIKIDTVTFSTNYTRQGTASCNISDVWVYVNNEHVGTYELPAMFPVLKSGKSTVIIYPGIKVNGIAATRMYYPFYSRDTMTVNLVQGEVFDFSGDLTPSFTYTPQSTFAWMEDFEDYQSSLVKTSKSGTIVNIYSGDKLDPKYGGRACGQMVLHDSTTFLEVYNSEKLYNVPNLGDNIYLEFNYLVDAAMTVGIYAYYESSSNIVQTAIMRVNPTTEWKKMYVYMTNTIANYYAADAYRVYFSAGDFTADTITNSSFYIDNIKLIY